MGKPYDFEYHFNAESVRLGQMVCLSCNKPIVGEETHFVAYKKNKSYDWGYVTHHRSCYHSDEGWAKIERKIAAQKKRTDSIESELLSIAQKYKISDAYSFAELACFALGEDIEDYLT